MTRCLLQRPHSSSGCYCAVLLAWTLMLAWLASPAVADEIQLFRANPDPYGYPRPAPGETDVPVGTSLFLGIGFKNKDSSDTVLPDSVAVRIRALDGSVVDLVNPGRHFAEGYSGKIGPGGNRGPALIVYIDGEADLQPLTTYTVSVEARTRDGSVLNGERGSWQFTTGNTATRQSLGIRLDLTDPPVRWHGGFFTGFCKPSFCTSASNRIPGYELMDRVRRRYPRAWSLQRDFSMTGMEHQPRFLLGGLPNVVRERETRRITEIQRRDNGMLLLVEDFFGHEQYGIVSGRPLSDDYQVGDEVLIADGVGNATANVVAVVDDTPAAKSLLVTFFESPKSGWKIEYARPLPEKEDPDAPGLFPSGGCYLRKLRPSGTPHYYWGRLDREWDIAHRFGRRLVVNFTDAPGDLSVDGRNWTYPKDYLQYHRVVHTYTSHLIERYGDACLDFVWSVFNEPDLASAFWRSGDWNELQRFYDYTVDAILRSFEDHGYDSDRVIVGGLEIGAIFGTHIERPILKIFLSHCSPRAAHDGALPRNAAFTDQRLEGQRSRRVEEFCRASGGKGCPCDFISVHSYNASAMTAAKLKRAKEIALETDAEYYADLWVNSFETCPGWAPPPDVAAADSYLGNGYFPTWCADVARRQLAQAAGDARYAFGETILTFWPWPNQNFGGHNAATRVIAVDDDGDGKKDREETVAMPILNFLELLTSMGDTFRVLPEQTAAAHVVSGFASKQDDALCVLLYAHDSRDIQSRSKATFHVSLDVEDVPWSDVRVQEYRFDQEHNSYYRLGRQLRDRLAGGPSARRLTVAEVDQLTANLTGGNHSAQIAALKKVATVGDRHEGILAAVFQLYQRTEHQDVRAAIEEVGKQIFTRQVCYAADEVSRVRELSTLRVTRESHHAVGTDRALQLAISVAANGVNFLVITPLDKP